MKTLNNIGCALIGWDKNILKECGEASHRQFRKLISAICIMMILWGTIGYCFADRYINIESLVLKICIALMFMLIVLCVERVIILTVGKARLMTVMRVMLALCMAILGSCIFDQIIFRNDIEQAIQTVHPYAIDISSGVETNRVKDANKIRMCVQKGRKL